MIQRSDGEGINGRRRTRNICSSPSHTLRRFLAQQPYSHFYNSPSHCPILETFPPLPLILPSFLSSLLSTFGSPWDPLRTVGLPPSTLRP